MAPQTLQNYLDKDKQLSSCLYSLTQSNVENTLKSLKSSDLLTTKDKSIYLFSTILFAIATKGTSLELLIELTFDLSRCSECFKSVISFEIFFQILDYFSKIGYTEAALPLSYTAYKFYDKGLFSFLDGLDKFMNYYSAPSTKSSSFVHSTFLLWFMPEIIEQIDSINQNRVQILSHFFDDFKKNFQCFPLTKYGIDKSTLLSEIDANMLRKEREKLGNEDRLYNILKTDNVDELKQYTDLKSDNVIHIGLYENHIQLNPVFAGNDKITVMDVAAFYNAKECIDFIVGSGENECLGEKAVIFKIMNNEITSENIKTYIKKKYTQKYIETCILCHSNDILETMLKIDKSKIDNNQLFLLCLISNNSQAAQILMKNDIIPHFFYKIGEKTFILFLKSLPSSTTQRLLMRFYSQMARYNKTNSIWSMVIDKQILYYLAVFVFLLILVAFISKAASIIFAYLKLRKDFEKYKKSYGFHDCHHHNHDHGDHHDCNHAHDFTRFFENDEVFDENIDGKDVETGEDLNDAFEL